jgi:low affinity Fe/Cu permease
MVFLIQNSQNRDAAAMQAKLDELIRAVAEARGQFIGIEHKTEREIEKIRADLEKECADEQVESPDKPSSDSFLDNLIRRR